MSDEHTYFDPERELGFLTNFENQPRKRFAYKLAGWLTGYRVWFEDNCTDCHGRPLNDPKYRALYVLPRGNKTKYWRVVERIEKIIGKR